MADPAVDPAPDPKPDDAPPWGSDEDFNPERAWTLVQELRADVKKAQADRDEVLGEDGKRDWQRLRDRLGRAESERTDLQKKLKQHEEASQTEEEKRENRAKEAEQQAKNATSDAARLRVALRKGLTETQAKRLVGENDEDLEKDADELLASFKTEDEPAQEPGRRPRERLRPGAAPSANSEPDDPAKLAEGVPRW